MQDVFTRRRDVAERAAAAGRSYSLDRRLALRRAHHEPPVERGNLFGVPLMFHFLLAVKTFLLTCVVPYRVVIPARRVHEFIDARARQAAGLRSSPSG